LAGASNNQIESDEETVNIADDKEDSAQPKGYIKMFGLEILFLMDLFDNKEQMERPEKLKLF
jgi:hypothetical protein